MAARRVVPGLRLLLWRPRLRTHMPAIMLDLEDVAVEGRDPLLTLHGHLEITQGITDIALDLIPVELRVAVDHIGRTSVTELLVDAGLGEFVVERVQFAQVERIAQLTDQIAGPDQGRFGVGGGVVVVVRHREARELDARGDALLVDKLNRRETLPDEDLPPFHVVGCQESIGGAARGRHRIAGGIDHEMLGCVAGADASHISDVVVQRGQNGMAPIARRDGALEAASAQNVLDAEGDEGGVLAIVKEQSASLLAMRSMTSRAASSRAEAMCGSSSP